MPLTYPLHPTHLRAFRPSVWLKPIGKQYFSMEARDELLQRHLPVLFDNVSSKNAALCTTMLHDFMPKMDLPKDYAIQWKRPSLQGYHLVYFQSLVPASALLPDGTDSFHSPGTPYDHRLWAGGRMKFSLTPIWRARKDVLTCIEEIHDVRERGPIGSEKVFVTIRRYIGPHVHGESKAQAKKRILGQVRSFKPSVRVPILEERVLCFLRPKADGTMTSIVKSPKITPPAQDPYLAHTIVPTPALLFRFSALTFNAHAIHIDPEYARRVYGLPNLVVHGPLTLILMLELLRRALAQYAYTTKSPEVVVSEVEYTNLTPLYVDEPLTIACKPMDESPSVDVGLSKWSVWVQKAVGEETTVAVRATVTTTMAKDGFDMKSIRLPAKYDKSGSESTRVGDSVHESFGQKNGSAF